MEAAMSVVTWYGHSAFKIEAGDSSVVFDPFFAPATGLTERDMGAVDMVLLTHDHGDHVGDTVALCKRTGAMLGCVVGTAQVMVERGVPQSQILNGIGFNIGGTMQLKGIAATMVQAFHSSDSGVPTGYIVRMPDGLVIYHAGDTGIFSSMQLLGQLYDIDLALLPMGGVFTMDGYQAANACKLLGCKKVVPMHWGTFPVLAQNTDDFHKNLDKICPACEFVDIKPGKSIEIVK